MLIDSVNLISCMSWDCLNLDLVGEIDRSTTRSTLMDGEEEWGVEDAVEHKDTGKDVAKATVTNRISAVSPALQKWLQRDKIDIFRIPRSRAIECHQFDQFSACSSKPPPPITDTRTEPHNSPPLTTPLSPSRFTTTSLHAAR